jgi:hypothetical protein
LLRRAPRMVRPKASEENLKIALGFANTVTTSCSDVKAKGNYVNCRGSFSIFAALSHCFPKLVKCSTVTDPKDRQSISDIELYKYLAHNGYASKRFRSRIPGSHRWDKEYLRWTSIRWINPNEPEDLEMLKSRLVELIKCFPCTSSLDQDSLISFLSRACSQNPKIPSYSDSGSEAAVSLSRHRNSGERYSNRSGRDDFQNFPNVHGRIPCTSLRFVQIRNYVLSHFCLVHVHFTELLRSWAALPISLLRR